MIIPIASCTVAELRQLAADLREDGRASVEVPHSFILRLIDEIARLRDAEVVMCKTKWHDHEPDGVQLELLELTRMMGERQ